MLQQLLAICKKPLTDLGANSVEVTLTRFLCSGRVVIPQHLPEGRLLLGRNAKYLRLRLRPACKKSKELSTSEMVLSVFCSLRPGLTAGREASSKLLALSFLENWGVIASSAVWNKPCKVPYIG